MYRELFEYTEKPAAEADIKDLEEWCSFRLPKEYNAFLLETNGAETPVGVKEPDDSVVLWSAHEVSELTDAYCYKDYLPSLIAIGSDGGGESLVFETAVGSDPDAWPLYRVPFADITKETMVLLASSFSEWVKNGFPLKF